MSSRTRTARLVLAAAITWTVVAVAGAAAGALGPVAPHARPAAAEAAPDGEAPAEVTVQIAGLQMVPQRVEITTGTTVTWVNNEPADYPGVGGGHQIVADDGSWESPVIAPGTRWSRRFNAPGTVGYHCSRHTSTTGEIVVSGEPVVDAPLEQEVAITEANPDDPSTWAFDPVDLVVPTGTTVIWRNNGKNVHTVTGDNEELSSGDIAPGGTWKYTFAEPGSFAYHCTPHPWMTATMRVVEPGGEAPPPPPVATPAEHGQGHGGTPPSRATTSTPARVGRGPVRHEVTIVEPDPRKPFEWGFDPPTLDVKIGDVVTWRNTGSVEHTITSGTFDSGGLAPGATWERTFTAVGQFDYRCTPHPWMKGVVRVSELDAEALPPLTIAAASPSRAAAATPRAKAAQRTGEGPVRHEALIVEPDMTKPKEWRFDPPMLDIRAGDTVEWRNAGTMAHTVTAEDGTFDSGNLPPGATFRRTFEQPGLYAYRCTPHPWMKGMVRVADAAGLAPALPSSPAIAGAEGSGPAKGTETIEAPDTGSSKPFPVARPRWPRHSLIFPVSLALSGLVIALTYLLAVAVPDRRRSAATT